MVTYFTAINCDFKQHFRTGLHVTLYILYISSANQGQIGCVEGSHLPKKRFARCADCCAGSPSFRSVRGLAQFVPIARFSAKEHRARVDGRAAARHPHGRIEHAVRCATVKVSAESAGAVASTMFLPPPGSSPPGSRSPDRPRQQSPFLRLACCRGSTPVDLRKIPIGRRYLC